MATEVASAVVSLMPSFRGGQAAISRELGGIGDKAGKEAGGRFGRVWASTSLAPIRAAGAAAAGLFAGAQVVGFLKDAVTQASDLNETVSKTRVVFGPASAAVLSYARNANTALGQTQEQALAGAATFGVFGKSAGLQGKELSSFSTQMVTLASDMASFSNTTPDQAIEALGAALRGETEPIRAYGVLLDDASLRQEAVRQGIAKTTKDALTPQQKVLAAHALILKQTTDAQGDFSRTSGGLANQQRILAAQWADTKTQLGSALLPVVTQVVSAFNRFLPSLKGVGAQVGSVLGPALKTIAPLAKAFITGLTGGTAGGSGPFATFVSAGGTVRAFLSQLAGLFQKLLPGVRSFFGALKSAGAVIGPALGGFISALLPVLQRFGTQLVSVLGPGLRQIGAVISGTVAPALAAFLTAARPIAAFVLGILAGSVLGALRGVITFVQGALKIIAGILNVFAGIFTGDWSRVWQGIKQIASGVWQAIKGAFQVFINIGLGKVFKLGASLLGKIATGLFGKLRGLFSAGMSKLGGLVSSGVSAVVRFFAGLPGKAGSALGSLAGKLSSLATRAFNSLLSAARKGGAKAISYVKELPGRVLAGLGRIGSVLRHAGAALVGGLIDGIRSMIGRVRNAAGDVMQAVRDFLPGSPAKEGPLSGKGWSLYAGRHLVEDLATGIGQRTGGAQDALTGALTIPRPPFVPGVQGGLDGGFGSVPEVRVFIGDKELKGIVRTEVSESNRATKIRVVTGAGRL